VKGRRGEGEKGRRGEGEMKGGMSNQKFENLRI
jgi:hypothetical protein